MAIPKLSESEHNLMDDYLGRVLGAYKEARVSKQEAVSELAHVMAALDKQNTSEAVAHFKLQDKDLWKSSISNNT